MQRILTEIRKLKRPLSQFCPMFRGWGKLGIPNLARVSLLSSGYVVVKLQILSFLSYLETTNRVGKFTHPIMLLKTQKHKYFQINQQIKYHNDFKLVLLLFFSFSLLKTSKVQCFPFAKKLEKQKLNLGGSPKIFQGKKPEGFFNKL